MEVRCVLFLFFSSRRRHTRYWRDWSSDVCSSDLVLRRFPGLLERATTGLGAFFDPTQLVVFEKFFQWQVGAATLGEAMRSFRSWTVDVTRIRVPVLSMVGDGEGPAFRRQAREVHELLPGPKVLRTFPPSSGADAHTQANNLRLAQEVIFDWLGEVVPDLAASTT